MSGDCPKVQGWRLTVTFNRSDFEALEEALADHADAVVAETMVAAHPARDALSDELRVTLFGTAPAVDDPRPARLLALLRTAGVAPDGTIVEPVCPADWEAKSLASFPPVAVGRFTIHGGHEAATRRRFAVAST